MTLLEYLKNKVTQIYTRPVIERLPRFCEYQIYAKGTSENAFRCSPKDPEAKLFCKALLDKSQHSISPCTYDSKEIYQYEGVYQIGQRNPEGKLVGICEFFHPKKHFKSDLMQNHN